MGLFDQWFLRRMEQGQVGGFVAQRRAEVQARQAEATARLAAQVSSALGRLGVQAAHAPEGSLAWLVRERVSSLQVAGGVDVTKGMEVVRDCLEACEHSPVSGVVRQVLVGFEPVLQELQEVADEGEAVGRVERAFAALEDERVERQEVEAKRRELDGQIGSVQARAARARERKAELVNAPDVVARKEGLRRVREERKQAHGEITALFDPVLPLFARSEHPLLSRYVEDPVQALVSDFPLRVIKEAQLFAASLQRSGYQDTVALAQVSMLKIDVLAPLVHRYANARKGEERMLGELESLPVAQEVARLAREVRECERMEKELRERRDALVVAGDRQARAELVAALRAWKIILV